ncbi:predicted protein [Nematostella vectensis]|uniref:C2H2-type domain-containing protein n=1 Tax=Nematostella vectensis TaxID=45351 RepID=A7RM44_NEMVE|nr:predicted protein [Nematostella vectensis]|eukprot:XP_001639602.1 predicted protein [Nematostella vectensis]
MPRDDGYGAFKRRLESPASQRKLKRRSIEDNSENNSPFELSERNCLKSRKIRKLPSLENLQSPSNPIGEPSPPARLDDFLTSTPRLREVSERLAQLVASPNKVITQARTKKQENYKKATEKPSLEGFYTRKGNTYICLACKQRFKYFSNIKSHLKVVHRKTLEDSSPLCSPENPRSSSIQCEICERKFKYLSNLRTHLKVHSVV